MTLTKTKGEFKKSARIVSDYENDLIFEQPRDGLVQQTLTTYENVGNGMKKTEITRKFTSTGDYNDHSMVSILPNNL